MKILLKISYLGTNYCGYQVQPNGVSIQQKLNEAARATFGFDCDIVGCSRTDSGVHANAFRATVAKKGCKELPTAIPAERIPYAMSANLPADICVFGAEWVSDDFHARYAVVEKAYLYRMYNRAIRSPFEEDRAAHIPKHLDDDAIARMNCAATTFLGTQDFSAYMAQGSKIVDTVRTVTAAEVFRDGDTVIFRVAANGFLYNMVRIMTGTLLAVGQGKLTVEDVIRITASHDRTQAGTTMPACGLYLDRVVYPD